MTGHLKLNDIPNDFIINVMSNFQKKSIILYYEILCEYKVRRQSEKRNVIIKDLSSQFCTSHNNIERIINQFYRFIK